MVEAPGRNVTKLRFSYDGKEDFVLVEPGESDTWVVFFHSYGGNALELYQSSLIHPLWIDAIRAEGLGAASFECYGDSWMAPFVADAIHHVLAELKARYGIKRFLFVGASMGGSAVLAYCVRYPEEVFAAVALCPVSDIETHYRQSLENPDPGFYMKSWPVEKFYGATDAARKRAFAQNSVQAHVSKLGMPLAIAHGTNDTFIAVTQSDTLAELLKNKKDFVYFRYPDANHFFPSQQGFQDAWSWILQFLPGKQPEDRQER